MAAKIKRDWWKKKWPPLGDQSAGSMYDTIYQALKVYERACRGISINARETELEQLETLIAPAIGGLKKEFKLPATRSVVQKNLQGLAHAIAMERGKLISEGDKVIHVWSRNYKQSIRNIGRLDALANVNADKYAVSLSLPVVVMRELENAGADGRLFTELDAVFDEKIKKINSEVTKDAGKNGGIVALDHVNPRFSQAFKELEYAVEAIPGRVLTQVAKNKRFARKYKRYKGVKITKSGIDVAIAAASFAVPGEQALAILGVIRALADLSQEIVNLCMTIERTHKILAWELERLQKSYEKARTSKEIGKQVVNSVVGTDVMSSTAKVVKDFKEFRGAIALVSVRMGKKQVALTKIQKEIPNLEAELANLYAEGFVLSIDKNSKTIKNIKNAQSKVDLAIKEAAKLKTAVDKNMGRLRKAESALPPLKKAIIELQAGQSKSLDFVLEKVDQAIQMLFFAGSYADISATGGAAQSYGMLAASDWKKLADELKELKKLKTK